MTGLALVFAGVAAFFDLRTREIPNWIAASLLVCAAVGTATGLSGVPWSGFLLGALIGLAVTVPLFAVGAFGGGDVKLVVALGAALGPVPLLAVLFWVAMCGGVLAVIAILRGRRTLAYAPAIAMGLFVYWIHLELAVHASA